MKVEDAPSGLVVTADDETETDRLGAALAGVLAPNAVVGLVGPLGAGKTRLSRAVATALGADPGAISSPTFVLIHEYDARIPVYHFDTYRLAGVDEFRDLDPQSYFQAGGICLVEWADRFASELPDDAWTIAIEPDSETGRRFTVRPPSDDLRERLLRDLT